MRALWEGAISFGLIHIPVKLYTASQDRPLKFQYLRKADQCKIGYVKVCKSTGEEVAWDSVVKGYEYQKGDYVILSDADFKMADAKRSEVIEIEDFVDEKEIDPIYFEKPYYIGPEHKSDKVYNLLLEALKKTRKVGIGKFVMRNKEQLIALKAEKDLLILNVLRFEEEIKKPAAEIIPKHTELSERELIMAMKLIDKLSGHFKPGKYQDSYTEKLEAIIEAKAKGKKPKLQKIKHFKSTEVPDLMATLKASLENTHSKHSSNSKAKKPTKPAKSTKKPTRKKVRA
ncbi:MAG: Ku protein [Candidatus Altimarinota bacterium]